MAIPIPIPIPIAIAIAIPIPIAIAIAPSRHAWYRRPGGASLRGCNGHPHPHRHPHCPIAAQNEPQWR
ncbi:MAG: hypothetical protein Fur005_37920 [Roseiflexaceae bacterium]